MMELVAVTVVVLFVLPGLFYVLGLLAKRYGGKAPRWIGLPSGQKTMTGKTEPEPRPRRQA